jgi:hypothetical protein
MEALLDEDLINELLSDDAIVEWLATRADPMPILQPKAGALNTEDKARAAVREICQKGLFEVQTGTSKEVWSWLNKTSVSNLKTLTDAIAGEAVENANEHLEELMSLQPMYGEAAPTLSLGSILKSERPATGESPASADYWICVQPSCDCFIRTDGTNRRRGFPFLPLKTVEIPPFDIVLRDGVSWVRLKCEAKQFRISMFNFEATNAEGSIESTIDDERYRFITTEGQIFTYLGQLKFPQAQRVAQNLSSDVGRVGLTETEWLRILSGKKD